MKKEVKFKPSPKRVLIETIKMEDEDKKIIIPEQFQKNLNDAIKPIGYIIAKGDEVEYYSVGDKIETSIHAGMPIQVGEQEFLLIHENEIYGVHYD